MAAASAALRGGRALVHAGGRWPVGPRSDAACRLDADPTSAGAGWRWHILDGGRMDRPVFPAPLLAAALVLTACAADTGSDAVRNPDAAGQASPPAEESAAPTAVGDPDPCNAQAPESLIGEQASEEIVERARTQAGASMVRTLRPDQAVTMEYRAGRLNIDVDENGVITGFRCG